MSAEKTQQVVRLFTRELAIEVANIEATQAAFAKHHSIQKALFAAGVSQFNGERDAGVSRT